MLLILIIVAHFDAECKDFFMIFVKLDICSVFKIFGARFGIIEV